MGIILIHINFYMKKNCPLCDEALEILNILKADYPFTLTERNIYTNDEWLERYLLIIPVIEIGDQQLHAGEINFDSIRQFLKYSSDQL